MLKKGTFAEVSVRASASFSLNPERCPGLKLDRPVGAKNIPMVVFGDLR